MSPPAPGRILLLTVTALLAFAANSILCRLALRSHAIDPGAFVLLRLVAGAVVLAPFAWRTRSVTRPSWSAAIALLAYAAAFSFAYVSLAAGTGALLLFGAVQATMIAAGLVAGERPRPLEWLGLALAAGGLVWLVAPGVEAPPAMGAASMIVGGIAWGAYSLLGRGTKDPAGATAWNFLRAASAAVLVEAILAAIGDARITATGAILAILSGAVTSGLGYVVWYAALRGLTATTASVVQLTVPAIAAVVGISLLGEPATVRVATAGALILGGVGVAVLARRR